MLRFNTFRANRFLRSKFVEGKYLLASEATDLELEIFDQLRKVVKETVGESVAIDDAWKIERLNATQVLIKPGQAWVKGLPFSFRNGKDQLVSGAILSIGTVPVGAVVTDDSNGLGKIITFNNAATTPTNLYRVVITAKEELITEVDDPFLQNVNLTESTAQKIRLNYQLNIVPDSLQTESPIPYRDETSSSLSVTNFPNAGGLSAPNFVNQTVVTPTFAGNGHLVALNVISGAEGLDGRDLELVIRNDPALSGGRFLPNSPTLQVPYSNGKLIDSHGNMYHINAIFNDIVSTQVVIRIDKEPDQPNPEIVDTLPYTVIKRDVFVTDDSNGSPQGRLHYPIATIDWNSTNGIVHASKVVDLRTVVSKQDATQLQLVTRDNLEMVGGGNVSYNPNTFILTWPAAFSIVNPHGPLQTVAAGSAPLTDGGSLAYDMNLTGGGAIQRGTLSVTISSGGTTATLAAVDLSLVRIGNVLVDSTGALHVITAIDDVANTVSASTSMATGAAVIYKDSYGPGKAPLNKNTFILAVRSGTSVLIGGEEEQVPEFEDRNLKLIRGGTWEWGAGGSPVNFALYNTGVNSVAVGSSGDAVNWYGQGFTTTAAGNVTSAYMALSRAVAGAVTGNITLQIYTNAAGVPGTLLGTSDPRLATSINSSFAPLPTETFTFSTPVAVSNATSYFLVVNFSGTTGGPFWVGGQGLNPYAGGQAVSTSNSGGLWTPSASYDFVISVDGTTAVSNALTWDADAYISIPGLAEARNRIVAGTAVLANDGDVAYVNINRVAGAPATLPVTVAAIADVVPTEDLLIIARRTGTDVIVGNQSTLLAQGQSSKLYSQMSDQTASFTGASGAADDSPDYSSNTYVTDGDSLEDAIGDLDLAVATVSGAVTAIQWKAPVANFAALPGSGNTDGDVRLVLDTRLIYTWKSVGSVWVETGMYKAAAANFAALPATNNVDGDVRLTLDTRVLYAWSTSATAWIEMGYWKVPVANAAALPLTNNKNGDVRITLDTRVAYSWDTGTSSWKPLNGTGGGVKIIGGGTVSWSAPNLTFTADMFLEIKGLAYGDNTIAFSTQSPIALASSLQVAYVIPNLATGGPSLTVVVGALSTVPANAIIIARREGADVIVGSSSTRLVSGQSTELYAQESIQTRNTIRSTDFLRSDNPVTWTGTQFIFSTDVVLESLNTRLGTTKLSTILVANSPITLTAGQIAYVVIDRSTGSSNVTPVIASSVPVNTPDNNEVIILFKRVDVTGVGYLHIPLHKQVLDPGQTVRLGASGTGSGNANAITETVKNRLLDSTFALATPNIFSVDTEDNVDGASTGDYSLVTKTFDLDTIGQTLVTTQLLDDNEFLNNDDFLKEVELLVFWTQGFIDPIATYEVSRNGGNEWQSMDMERIGNTELFRGVHVFDEEASNQTLEQQALASSDGDNDLDSGAARKQLSQLFTVASKQLVRQIRLRTVKTGSPAGSVKVSIYGDNAGSPNTTILSEGALVSLTSIGAGTNNTTFEMPDVTLAPGNYHIVVESDAAYRASYSDGVTELALRSLAAGTPVAKRSIGNGSWVALTSKTVFEVIGIALDLRVRITSGTIDVKLDGYATLYDRLPGILSTGVKELEVFQAVGNLNITDFVVSNFLVNPEMLRVYDVNSGQVYRYGAFSVNGNTVSFSSGQFYDPGNTITLIFDQTQGGQFDNSDLNALLMATNHLGSTDANVDRSIAGRGIFLRRPDGTLREITIDDNDMIAVFSV